MEDLQKTLIDSGLNKKEAQVYLTALELGRFSMTAISAKSRVKRPTCYLILEQLINKGLISKAPQPKKMMYVAEPPEKIEEELKKKYIGFRKSLPLLKTLGTRQKKNPEIQFFRGAKGVEAVYKQVLDDAPKQVCSILNTDRLFSVTGKEFLDDWIKKRTAKGIHIDSLMTIPNDKQYFYESDPEILRKTTFFKPTTALGGALWFYNNKVAFVSSKEDDFSFIVSSEEFRKTVQGVFEVLKEKLEKEKTESDK